MIHTVELNQQLTHEEYIELLNEQKELGHIQIRPDKHNADQHHTELKVLSDNGIIFEFKHICKRNYTGYYIYLRLNSSKLLEDNRLAIFTPERYPEIEERFKTLIESFFGSRWMRFSDINSWRVRRVDYCVQFKVHDAQTYIKLFQRGDKPARGEYCIPNYHYKDAHISPTDELRKSHKDGSVYFRGGHFTRDSRFVDGSMNINFYDKHSEMSAPHNDGRYTADELEAAKNIIRIEIQCLRRKIDALSDRDAKRLSDFLDIETGRKILLSKYDEVCGKGDYYKLQAARNAVTGNSLIGRTKTQERCKRVLELCSGLSTVWKKRINNGKQTEKEFNKALKKLNENGINPTTLPARCELDQLPSLHDRIEQYFNNMQETIASDMDAPELGNEEE